MRRAAKGQPAQRQMEQKRGSFESLPLARSCRRIDFDLVELREAAEFGGRLLLVSGIKPWADLHVTLEPLVYMRVPDFWVIEVVGRLTSGLPGLVDYCAALRLGSIRGRKGIEIVGATRLERKVFPPGGKPGPHAINPRLG